MTPESHGEPPDARFLDGDALRVARAVHRLRFMRPGCSRALARDALAALLLLALVLSSLWLGVLGLDSQVVTVYRFPR